MCSFTDIVQSRVDLADIALMNELIDLRHYNDRILAEGRQNPEPAEFYVPAQFRQGRP